MNPSYNEREVLALLQEESTQKRGFEMIVAQYSEQLYWQIRRMVLSHEDANDLLQNTFIKAWINIDYFRAEAKLSTWLYRPERVPYFPEQTAGGGYRVIGRSRSRHPSKAGERSLLLGRQGSDGFAESAAHIARKTTYGVQPEVLPGNEIRANVRYLRYFRRSFESVLPSCREKNREDIGRRRLNL